MFCLLVLKSVAANDTQDNQVFRKTLNLYYILYIMPTCFCELTGTRLQLQDIYTLITLCLDCVYSKGYKSQTPSGHYKVVFYAK